VFVVTAIALLPPRYRHVYEATGEAYLEVQDDGPYQTKSELRITVHDVLRSDVDQLDLLVAQKVEGHLHILQHVETHPTFLSRLKNAIGVHR